MRAVASSAHSQYWLYLKELGEKNEIIQDEKRKAESADELISLEGKKTLLEREVLKNKANELPEKSDVTKDL
ncbi:hypothetical protein X975_00658, partial [Stegodyphus mimosarum]